MNITKEWKNIKGYECLYKVSNYGEVKAKRKVIYDIIDGEMQPSYVAKEHIMKPFDNGNGYLVVSLIGDDGTKKNHYIHRLVADAFLPNPNGLPQVNHLDYDRKNNKVNNLEWCSAVENARYSICNRPKIRTGYRSSTGHRFIYMRGDKYRVSIQTKDGRNTDKRFDSLQEAIEFRNRILGEKGVEYKDYFN